MGSLTTLGKTKIILHSSKYMLAGKPSGPLLLKVIIQETSVNTNASSRHIRDNLTSLDSYMRFAKSDILAFNMHVRSLLDTLHSCGETTNDLLSNLFRGYKAASDSTFTQYIQRKEEQFDDGESITPDQLMQHARNKYVALRDEGRWNSLSKEDTKLVAMQAELKCLKSSQGQFRERPNNFKRPPFSNKPRPDKGYPAWKRTPPKDGEPHTKTVDGKLFHWCPNHKMWAAHHPSECYKGPRPGNQPNPGKKPRLKLALANTAITYKTDS
jgi:hypothetical protein